MSFHAWAIKWQIPPAAIRDLVDTLGLDPAPNSGPAGSEAWAQSAVRLEASQKGMRLWRNNVGALRDEAGRVVRYGLANDSAQLNSRIKSSDLIGIKPLTVTADMVGHTVGVMLCREIKAPGWRYTGTDREQAQLAWINMINSMGGDAAFATGEGTL